MIVKLSLGDVERARLVLRGGSVLDWRRLNVTSLAEGDAILRVNGFDPETQEDRARLREIRLSAIDYLERNCGFDFAPEIVNAESPSKLMLLAAGGDPLLRRQACIALKVMHVVHHVDARELKSRLNISDRALHHLVEEKTTHVIREMKTKGYPIIDFQSSRKTHDSIITKLLSKRRGSSEPLYDMIRFRIVTATIDEIVPVVAYLSYHLFPFHFTVPGKSHNSIFNFKDFIRRHPRISKMIPELQVDLRHEGEMIEPSNPDTSSTFKSVNFIVDLPIRLDEQHLEVWAPGIKLPSRVVHVLSEFQIVDQASASGNKNGDASHDSYKARRMTKVKERLLYGRMIWRGKDGM